MADRCGSRAPVGRARRRSSPPSTGSGDLDPAPTRGRSGSPGSRRSDAPRPVIDGLATRHPGVGCGSTNEPVEALDLLARDDVDLALTYDYTLAPASWRSEHQVVGLWADAWGLAVPRTSPAQSLADVRDQPFIVNSRHTADEDVVRRLASIAGFTPRVVHRIDALELVEDLVVAGLGVALLPQSRPVGPEIRVLPLTDPAVSLRAYAVTRRGRDAWPPLRAVLEAVTAGERPLRRAAAAG
jgi:DNA-binding transcriptional LysR family regulator